MPETLVGAGRETLWLDSQSLPVGEMLPTGKWGVEWGWGAGMMGCSEAAVSGKEGAHSREEGKTRQPKPELKR